MSAVIPESERRIFTAKRVEQGFRSQAHLDAVYRHFDHTRSCEECQQPGEPMPLDDGMQPTMRECAVATELFRASFAENFEREAVS